MAQQTIMELMNGQAAPAAAAPPKDQTTTSEQTPPPNAAAAATQATTETPEGTGAAAAAAPQPGTQTPPIGITPPAGTPPAGTTTEAPEGTEDEEENPMAFWDSVNKLHGFDDSFKVDFGQVDPTSPEGAVIREKALIALGQTQLDNYLKQSDPEGYAYMLHRKAGGTRESFFQTPEIALPIYEELKNSVDLQRNFFSKHLMAKGIEQEIVTQIIDKAVKDGKLLEKVDKAYQEDQKIETDMVASAQRAAAQREQQENQIIQSANKAILDEITASRAGSLIIPDAKKEAFTKHVNEKLYFDAESQQVYLFKPVDRESIKSILEAEYFAFVKGDINALVRAEQNREAGQKLRLKGKQAQGTPPASATEGPSTNKNTIMHVLGLG